jgi:hypothetical protein
LTSVLIGYTGFVGGSLAQAEPFDIHVNRANLETLAGRHFDRIVCAGLPAAKWIANRDPEADRRNMWHLCDVLGTVTTDDFVLISTIDVYPQTSGADEDFDCGSQPNHAYGAHRFAFERCVRTRFPHGLIVRLPALFGTGLRKNVLFDLLNGNQLELINPDSRFQWYPLGRLPQDIRTARGHGLRLVNLFTEPVATREILHLFPNREVGSRAQAAAHYDLRTRHAAVFGGHGSYVMSAPEVMRDVRGFCEMSGAA